MKFIEDIYCQFDKIPDSIRLTLMAISTFILTYAVNQINPATELTVALLTCGFGVTIMDAVLMKVGRHNFYDTKLTTRQGKLSLYSKFIILGLTLSVLLMVHNVYILVAYASYEIFKFTSYSQYQENTDA